MPATDLLVDFARRYTRLNGSVLTGHLTYRIFLWLAPFLLVLVALLGISVGDQEDIERLMDTVHVGGSVGGAFVVVLLFLVIALVRGEGPLLQVGGVATAWTVDLGALQLVAQTWLPRKIESSSALYGGIGAAFATLFYLWLLASLLVGSAFANAIWTDRHDLLQGRPLIADPDRLPGFLRRPVEWIVRTWRRWIPAAGSAPEDDR